MQPGHAESTGTASAGRRHRRTTWRRVCALALAAGLAVPLGGAYCFAGRWAAADHRRVGPPPAELPAQSVEFRNPAGDLLRGWYVPGSPGGGGVLLMHGSHETRRAMIGRARFLHERGYAVFLFAGTEDPRTTLAESRRLFAAAPEPKEFWAVPGAAHTNFQRFAPAAYEARLLAFLDRYLRRPFGH